MESEKGGIKLERNGRGFIVGKFRDRYQQECSIQESSLATEACIWLGCNEMATDPVTGEPYPPRMHLTQEMAEDLIELLTYFVELGHLPVPVAEAC